jgi:hypothetical protein
MRVFWWPAFVIAVTYIAIATWYGMSVSHTEEVGATWRFLVFPWAWGNLAGSIYWWVVLLNGLTIYALLMVVHAVYRFLRY